MDSSFNKEERRKYMFRKHIRNHLFEYILDFIGPVVLTAFVLYMCNAEKYIYGIVLAIAYSAGKTVYNLYHYKKEYTNIDIRE